MQVRRQPKAAAPRHEKKSVEVRGPSPVPRTAKRDGRRIGWRQLAISGERNDAKGCTYPGDRSAACGIGGPDRRRADLARGRQHQLRRAKFYADRTGRLPGMGTVLPAGVHPGVRTVPLLVPPLLVTHAPATGPSRSAALIASVFSEMYFLHSRGRLRRALRADC
jgi:hypothetical protein